MQDHPTDLRAVRQPIAKANGLPNAHYTDAGVFEPEAKATLLSALAGAMPTEDKGIVWFSLINYGAGLDALRSRQDQVISALEQQWGKASGIPPELKTTVVIGQAPYQFGTPERNVSIFGQ